jgi:uncharacterized protein
MFASRATVVAPRIASPTIRTGRPDSNYLCPSFKAFFHHVDGPMRAMSGLLTAGRAPSELVRAYATEDAKRGRNEACTCGWERTWKQCHGAQVPASR